MVTKRGDKGTARVVFLQSATLSTFSPEDTQMNHTLFLLMVGCWIGGLAGLLTKGLTMVAHPSSQELAELKSFDGVSTN